jgi:hypothetical protein
MYLYVCIWHAAGHLDLPQHPGDAALTSCQAPTGRPLGHTCNMLPGTPHLPPQTNTQDWTHPPFSGAIAEGFIWGRGTMDVKGGALGLLEALTALLQQGYTPTRTLLVALGHDEEVGGFGAREAPAAGGRRRGGGGSGCLRLMCGMVANACSEGSVGPGPVHVPSSWCKCARATHGHTVCSASMIAKSYAVWSLTHGFVTSTKQQPQ